MVGGHQPRAVVGMSSFRHLLVDGSYEEISYRTQQAGIYILVANKIIIQCTINERNKLPFLMYTDKQ